MIEDICKFSLAWLGKPETQIVKRFFFTSIDAYSGFGIKEFGNTKTSKDWDIVLSPSFSFPDWKILFIMLDGECIVLTQAIYNQSNATRNP